ncbi:GAF domain-containing protein [Mucilaginibacter sp. RS28]|uniref:GAF domain-containing protein n=1 Tax=Mucilaginibacter straminoryzae TaxID=2932774 RepID=A0A9X1X178_9SPHI|nr:GAF domain-containing protein [Mucilaginibacter straminoryzae]MCJ8208520.1 GAF domain-containing protein [Mucilaginibacter straminoryzae]
MEVDVFQISKSLTLEGELDTAFSFRPFIRDMHHRIETEHTIRAQFYRFVLQNFNNYPQLDAPITAVEALKYPDILELIYAVLSPSVTDEHNFHWAIGTPLPGNILYSTPAFKDFVELYHQDQSATINQGQEAFKNRQKDFVYRLILKKLYKISSDIDNDTIYTKLDETNCLLEKYYKIHIDTAYVDVSVKGELPTLRPEVIEQFLHEGADPGIFDRILPLDLVTIEGFSIITVEDVTAQQSIDNIRLALVNDAEDQNQLFAQVTHSLQTLTGNSCIEFGLLPFLKVNGRLVYDAEECFNSILIQTSSEQGMAQEAYQDLIESYIKKPKAIFFNEICEDNVCKHFYLKALQQSGIKSYALLPVYYNRQLAGVMEIYSRKTIIYYEKLLSKLEAAVPLLSQLLHNSIEQFNQRIEDIIKEQFTSLQHAVEWKFNEAAWNYLRQERHGSEANEIQTVAFKDLYPLYGAIDIRNSTHERNEALQRDLVFLLEKIIAVLQQANEHPEAEVDSRLIAKCEAWLQRINKQVTDNDDTHIRAMLQTQIYALFDELKVRVPALREEIEAYFEAENEETGEGFKHRRALENSIGKINQALNGYFEKAQQKLQQIYPCYFEKFRTDGVEYDVYTGKSLAPDMTFDEQKLNEFRRWQLNSMIDIVHITNKLFDRMECHLRTTQLIFIHSHPIDICFRKDEHRFDVEGAYNIRYEVIKKRIDKVLIKDTGERLTQPGKIALVYTTSDEAQEYLKYIKECCQQQLLTGETEHFELEELQGVAGLRAIRVTVNAPECGVEK